MKQRYYITFINRYDDYPEVVGYDTEKELNVALSKDYNDSPVFIESATKLKYQATLQNKITDELLTEYFDTREHALSWSESKQFFDIYELKSLKEV